MSLDAKVTYTFLLNRFQLSRRNGWVNDYGEVFVIFSRKEAGFPMPEQEAQDLSGKNLQNLDSRDTGLAVAEPQKARLSYIKSSHIDSSYTDVSQSVSAGGGDGQADDEDELIGILDACELSCFPPEVARVFENAIERLFYLDHFRVGGATLPRSRVRAKLRLLDGMILRDAERKLRANLARDQPAAASSVKVLVRGGYSVA